MGGEAGFWVLRHLSAAPRPHPPHPANIAKCLCERGPLPRPLALCRRVWGGGPYHRVGAGRGETGLPPPRSPVILEVVSLLSVSEAEFCSCFTGKVKDRSCCFRTAFAAVTGAGWQCSSASNFL